MVGVSGLRDAVTDRRLSLGLTQREAATRGGFSVTVWSEVERGKRTLVSPRIAYKMDRALRWPEGTVEAIQNGGERPEPPAPDELLARLEVLEAFIRERFGGDL